MVQNGNLMARWWYWPLGNDPEGVIRNKVKDLVLSGLTKIEDMGGP